MVDPVDATFDTIYSWSQYLQRHANTAYRHLKGHAENTYEIINDAMGDFNHQEQIPNPFNNKPESFLSSKTIGLICTKANENKLITASTILATAFTIRHALKRNLITNPFKSKHHFKRRATRLANGARKDVILIVGSITDPITRYIAQDLEIRGFIVYITSQNTAGESRIFSMDTYSEIKPLIISSSDWGFNRVQLGKFNDILKSDHYPFPNAKPNKLNLSGVIVIPELFNLPKGKFHSLSSIELEKSLNLNLNYLLGLLNTGLLEITTHYDSNLVILQTIGLELPFAIPQNLINSNLDKLRELIKLEYPSLSTRSLKISTLLLQKLNKGQALKPLFYKVFDLVHSKPSWFKNYEVEFIGTGARLVYYLGSWVPKWLAKSYYSGYLNDGEGRKK